MRKTWKKGSFLVASLLAAAVPALAQDDPFAAADAAPAEPAAEAAAPAPAAEADPFGAPPTDSPFSPTFGEGAAAPDPFAGPDPFGGPGAAADAPAVNAAAPAAEPAAAAEADPFGAPSQSDPFAAPAEGPAVAPAADPFAAATAAPVVAPAPAPEAAPADPFGADPFGAPPTAVAGEAAAGDPFVAPSVTAATSSGGRGVAALYQFRFVESLKSDGRRVVTRKAMPKEEAEAFDKKVYDFYLEKLNQGQVSQFPGGPEADAWARWMSYAYQLDLWKKYCDEVVLAGVATKPSPDLGFPGDARAAAGAAGGEGGEAPLGEGGRRADGTVDTSSRNIYNENRSLDDQLGSFFVVNQGGGNAPQVVDPKYMDTKAKSAFEEYYEALRAMEKDQERFVAKLVKDLAARRNQREEYADWRKAQKAQVLEFVEEWTRRYDGRVITIAGVRYELYSPANVPTQTYRGANVVVTDFDITPYDILNEDGSLRGPTAQ